MKKNTMLCCERCQVYWTCETKWYRGEKGDVNYCCPICHRYEICLAKCQKQSLKKTPRKK